MKFKEYKQWYTVSFNAFIGYLTSLNHGQIPTEKQALSVFNTKKKDFINYILKTSNIKGIRDTKIVINKPIGV